LPLLRPFVVVSDVHLGHRPCQDVGDDLARLVGEHPGHEIVLNGDTFNLSCDAPSVDPGASAVAMIGAHPRLRDALLRHLGAGDPVTILAGNHDADVQAPAVRAALARHLTPGGGAALRVEPWFVRRGDVHIEHGQNYDADNAPAHPLAPPSYRSEPLGVVLSRRFLGPYNAYALGERYDATPLDNIRLMFRLFGAKAPFALLHYVSLLVRVNLETLVPGRLEPELRAGEAALDGFAVGAGVDAGALRELVGARPAPTHASASRTFGRFDFDGAIAALAVPGGGMAALAGAWPAGAAGAAAGLTYLVLSRKRRAQRSSNHMPEDLRAGASLVRRITGARTVVFGHSHREDEADGYINLGAFGDPPRPARTYVHVDVEGRAERRTLVRT